MSVLTFSFICQPNSSIIPPPVTKLSLAPPRHGVRRDEKEGKARSKRGLIQLGYKLLGIPKETLHIQPPICGHCLAIWDFFTQPLVTVSAPLLRSPTSLQAIFLGRIIELLLYKHHLPSPQPKHAFLATISGSDVHVQTSHLSSFPRQAGKVQHSLPPSRRRKSSVFGSYILQETKVDTSLS